jgi:hypothetical protein
MTSDTRRSRASFCANVRQSRTSLYADRSIVAAVSFPKVSLFGGLAISSIIAFCNLLIDATVTRDLAYLDRWGLRNDDAILASERHQALVDESVRDPSVFMTGGGSGQNTLVMAQWLL